MTLTSRARLQVVLLLLGLYVHAGKSPSLSFSSCPTPS